MPFPSEPTAAVKPVDGAVSGVDPSVPQHVAIIMDGNGRWAKGRGRVRSEGHRAGTGNVRRVAAALAERGVRYLTVYAFSTENWERPNHEVQALMDILGQAIRDETRRLHSDGVRIRHLGRLDRLSPELQQAIAETVEMTRNNTRFTLCVAFDYGGRVEILDAVARIVADGLAPEEITEAVFRRHLYTGEMPDPDLIIRTGGEMRLSNFLLWQSAYAEYFSTAVLWPDFGAAEVAVALEAYGRRRRKFGRVPAEEVP